MNLPEHLQDMHKREVIYNPNYQPEDDYILFYQLGDEEIPVMAGGDIVAIAGKVKSRKTLLKDCILSSRYTDDIDCTLNFKLKLPNGANILSLDFEQPYGDSMENILRFNNMVGYETSIPNFRFFNLRPYWYTHKLEQIQYLMEEVGNVKVLVIDQFVNLCKNENDDESVRNATFTLEKIAEEYKCAVIVLIHTNRGGLDTNGKAGSSLDKIIKTLLRVTKIEDSGVSEVSNPIARKLNLPKFSFKHRHNQDMPKFVDVFPDNNFI